MHKNFKMFLFLHFLYLIVGTVLLISEVIVITPIKIFQKMEFGGVGGVAEYKGLFYVTDFINNKIYVVDLNGNLKKTISSVGIRNGELYKPTDIVVKNKKIFVLDSPNVKSNRIQVFDLDGKLVSVIITKKRVYGMGVDGNNNIYVGEPATGKLVSVYSWKGKYLHGFGDLRKFSDFYGKKFKGMDNYYGADINAVNIWVEEDGNIYVSFVGAPFYRKYNKLHELEYERYMKSTQSDLIMREMKKIGKAPMRRGIWNVAIPFITTGITVDQRNKRIYITFQWKRGWIYTEDTKKTVKVFEYENKHLLFQKISIINSTGDLILPRHSSRSFNQVYIYNNKE